MSDGMLLSRREQGMVRDLTDALGASLDLHAVLKDAYGLLLPLVGADYGALATSRSERPEEYEWIVQDLPPAFLGSYEEMAPHDFVRNSVLSKINVVMRDNEMIARRALERNMMYHRAREVGSPLEQVMAVMLHAGRGFHSGLSLYRARRRPFAQREQRILQRLTPLISLTVQHCYLFANVDRRTRVLEALLGSDERAAMVIRPPAQEVGRTAAATKLLDAWFPSGERGAGGLPRVLMDWLAEARRASARGNVGSWTKTLEGLAGELHVELLPLPERSGEDLWALKLREVRSALSVPTRWRSRLTKREHEVVSAILRGWDTNLIAQELRCAPNTVKKHAQHIFEKLCVADRKALLVLAGREA